MTTYDRPHMLLTWRGDILGKPGKIEDGAFPMSDFSGSMRFASTNPNPLTGNVEIVDNDDAMTDLIADLTRFWQDPFGFIPNTFVIREVKWNRIDTSGHYANPNDTRVRDGLSIVGGTNLVMPPYICCVSTYTTGVKRGLASKGRTYWPCNQTPGGAGGLLTSDQQDTVASKVARLIRDWRNWNGIDGSDIGPVVMSGLRGGKTHPITGVAVGGELDVMQRRRIGREVYRTAAV